jgi:ribosomal protein S18 acetylase RimI-like enzyme
MFHARINDIDGTMHLRPATMEDLKTVITWIVDETACRTWAGPVVRFPMTVSSLKTDIEFDRDNTHCLDQAGRLLGFGQLIRKSESRLHMARVIIDPQERHRGNGKQLVRELMDLAWQKGCRRISLNVYRQNRPALTLYTSMGFREVAETSTPDLCHMIIRAVV